MSISRAVGESHSDWIRMHLRLGFTRYTPREAMLQGSAVVKRWSGSWLVCCRGRMQQEYA